MNTNTTPRQCIGCRHLVADHSHPDTDGGNIANRRGWVCARFITEGVVFSGWPQEGTCDGWEKRITPLVVSNTARVINMKPIGKLSAHAIEQMQTRFPGMGIDEFVRLVEQYGVEVTKEGQPNKGIHDFYVFWCPKNNKPGVAIRDHRDGGIVSVIEGWTDQSKQFGAILYEGTGDGEKKELRQIDWRDVDKACQLQGVETPERVYVPYEPREQKAKTSRELALAYFTPDYKSKVKPLLTIGTNDITQADIDQATEMALALAKKEKACKPTMLFRLKKTMPAIREWELGEDPKLSEWTEL